MLQYRAANPQVRAAPPAAAAAVANDGAACVRPGNPARPLAKKVKPRPALPRAAHQVVALQRELEALGGGGGTRLHAPTLLCALPRRGGGDSHGAGPRTLLLVGGGPPGAPALRVEADAVSWDGDAPLPEVRALCASC
jgi:hypothetical protein